MKNHDRKVKLPSGVVRWIEICMLTACAWVLTVMALPDYSSIEEYALQDSHTSMTDFYERAAAHSGVADLDTNVTIISIDNCTHDEIAEILDMVGECEPKAIGLDVIFYSLDNDTLLKDALKQAAPILTVPVNVGERMPSEAYINQDTLPEIKFGRAELAQELRGVPIRHYYLSVDGEASFVKQISLTAGYEIPDLEESETLRYGAREFNVVEARQMLDQDYIPIEDIQDKIILIGTINDPNDMHYTPIDNDMPGTMIHAYALSTLLSGRPVESFPTIPTYLIAMLFTAITIWLCLRVDNKPYANLVSRIIPLAIILIFIYLCYHFYNKHNLYIDFTVVLAMSASGMVCFDLYTGVPSLLQAVWRKTFKRNQNN